MIKKSLVLILCLIMTSVCYSAQTQELFRGGGLFIGHLVGDENSEGGYDSASIEIGIKGDTKNSFQGFSASLALMGFDNDKDYNGFLISSNINTQTWPIQASLGLGLMFMDVMGSGKCDRVYNYETKQYEDSNENCTDDALAIGAYPELEVRFSMIPKVIIGVYARHYFIQSVSKSVGGMYIGIGF